MRRLLRALLLLLATLGVLRILWPWHQETFAYESEAQATDYGEIRVAMHATAGLSHAGAWPRVFDILLATRLSGPPYDVMVSVDVPTGGLGAVTLTALRVSDPAGGQSFTLEHAATRLEPLISDTGSVFSTAFYGVAVANPRHDLRLGGSMRLDFKDKRHTLVSAFDVTEKAVHEETWTNALKEYWEGI